MRNIPHNCTVLFYGIMDKKSRSLAPLRKILMERKVSTYYLRNKCGEYNLDSKTIQRLMNDESVSTYTVNALCNILKCELTDIMEFHLDENTENIKQG